MSAAKLGYFEDGEASASNVLVLVTYYTFENDKNNLRFGNSEDLKMLRHSFETLRNCHYHEFSPTADEFLRTISEKDALLTLFKKDNNETLTELPSVFILYILSHGSKDGVIYTDHFDPDLNGYQRFNSKDVLDCLKKLDNAQESLKLVFFGPCRGDAEEKLTASMQAESDCTCTFSISSQQHNQVLVYSTVESTKARRFHQGSWLVSKTCDTLDNMAQDESLVVFLTRIQRKIHEASVNSINHSAWGQTPEFKIFSHRIFTFSKSTAIGGSDSKANTSKIFMTSIARPDFFKWQSDRGESVRKRQAAIFLDGAASKNVKCLQNALSKNLHFTTSLRQLDAKSLEEYFAQECGPESAFGCVLTCVLAPISGNEAGEICVQIGSCQKPIAEIVQKFVSPTNARWAGRPKIFIFINQLNLYDDLISAQQFQINATNNSGWLVCVLLKEESLVKLVSILEKNDLKHGSSLQEELVSKIISCKEDEALLDSTLQYLLDFPDWPIEFSKPSFTLKVANESEQFVSFEELLQHGIKNQETLKLMTCNDESALLDVTKEITYLYNKYYHKSGIEVVHVALPEFKKFFARLLLKKMELQFSDIILNASDELLEEKIYDLLIGKKIIALFSGLEDLQSESRKLFLNCLKVATESRIHIWIATQSYLGDEVLAHFDGIGIDRISFNPVTNVVNDMPLRSPTTKEVPEEYLENTLENRLKTFALQEILQTSSEWLEVKDNKIPGNAFLAGHFSTYSMYVCRAKHDGNLIPGRAIPDLNLTSFAWNTIEIRSKDVYEVLVGENFYWKPFDFNKQVPDNAVVGGHTREGKLIFVGKVKHDEQEYIGKILTQLRCCLAAFASKEYSFEECEILLRGVCENDGSDDLTERSESLQNEWVQTSKGNIPENAFFAGMDKSDRKIYIGRVPCLGDLIPGKAIPELNCAYICYDKVEYCSEQYEVLVGNRFEWSAFDFKQKLPAGAVAAGRTVYGEPLYVGRVKHEGVDVVGKIHLSHELCYIPFNGSEIAYCACEILVRRP